MADFELRIRPIRDGTHTRLRACLLPHRSTGGEDVPWSRMKSPPTEVKPVDPSENADREAPEEFHSDEFWLPAFGTKIVLSAGAPPGVAKALAQRQHLSLEAGAASDGHLPRLEASTDAEIVCYAGMTAARGGTEPDAQADTDREINAHRYAKLSILQILEAWRFPGTLAEYAEMGPSELMACLTHLVFEITLATASQAKTTLETWVHQKLTITHPDTVAENEKDLLPAAEGGAPKPHDVAAFKATSNPPEIEVLRAEVTQKADGIFFEVLRPEPKTEWLKTRALDECKLLLARSAGAVPLGEPPIIAASYMDVVEFKLLSDAGLTRREQPPIRIADHLAPETFAGEQLNYQLAVIDQFGDRVAAVAITLLRERFDPPPVASEPVARLIFGEGKNASIDLEAAYPDLERQLPAHLQIPPTGALTAEQEKRALAAIEAAFSAEMFFHERPLDECGFYGDDDDLALLEGLQQADVSYDPQAAATQTSPIPGHPLEDYLRGRFDREGLVALRDGMKAAAEEWTKLTRWEWVAPKKADPAAPGEEVEARKILKMTMSIPVRGTGAGDWFKDGKGYHFYLGLQRNEAANKEVRAALAMCRHALRLPAANEAVDADVFQLEWFTPPTAKTETGPLNERFLAVDRFDLTLLNFRTDPPTREDRPDLLNAAKTGQDQPLGVHLIYSHPVVASQGAAAKDFADAIVSKGGGDPLPIGGVRILVRDQAAVGQRLPFRVAETIQALPRMVALYRPVKMEAGLDAIAVGPAPTAIAEETPPPLLNGMAKAILGEKSDRPGVGLLAPGGIVEQFNDAVDALTTGKNASFRRRNPSTLFAGREPVSPASVAQFSVRLEAAKKGSAGDRAQEMREWAWLYAAAPDARRAEVAAAFQEPGAPAEKVDAFWRTWLASAAERLALDDVQLKVGDFLKLPIPEPATANAWHLLGPLIAVMREIGLVQDIVARIAKADDALAELQLALTTARFGASFPGVALIGLEVADGADVMATFRVVLLPWKQLLDSLFGFAGTRTVLAVDKQKRRRLFGACSAGPLLAAGDARTLRLRDQTRAPLNLPIRDGRLVRYAWRDLHDHWHHDLEFAVQLLDRYHRIRERYLRELHRRELAETEGTARELEARVRKTPDAAAKTQLEQARKRIAELALVRDHRDAKREESMGREIHLPVWAEKIVRTVVAPRREPLTPHPGVLPAFHRPDFVVAFEVQDSEERQKATHNILTRTRYGHIELQWSLRGELIDAATYPAALTKIKADATGELAEWWQNECEHAQNGLGAVATAYRPGSATLLEWEKPPGALSDALSEEAITPRTACDVLAFPHRPHFIEHHLECWHIADFLRGKSAHAHATRQPLQLCLPAAPVFSYTPALREVAIKLMLPRLADHLTEREREELSADELLGTLAGHLTGDEAKQWPLPLGDLPDLAIEFTFYLNVNPAGGPWKLKQLALLRRETPTPAPDANETPFGFSAKANDSVAGSGSLSRPSAARLQLKVVLNADLDPAVLTALATASVDDRLFLALRRGQLATDWLPVKRST